MNKQALINYLNSQIEVHSRLRSESSADSVEAWHRGRMDEAIAVLYILKKSK